MAGGSSVTIDGRSKDSMQVYGRDVALLGEIYGPVDISAKRIEIRGSARVCGDIVYSSRTDIAIDPEPRSWAQSRARPASSKSAKRVQAFRD